ncbi:hypothetical protein, partial [Actinomyces polynesiensis]|uniref:hypothetical protein n=1 Tax=Actinomyces polynesiensis TaxID=1325934 RepID=UPI0018CD4DDC
MVGLAATTWTGVAVASGDDGSSAPAPSNAAEQVVVASDEMQSAGDSAAKVPGEKTAPSPTRTEPSPTGTSVTTGGGSTETTPELGAAAQTATSSAAGAQDVQIAPLAAAAPLQCTAGYVYSISSAGQLRQIAPGGSLTEVGNTPATGSDFNGLGIGPSGSTAFAYLRQTSDNELETARIFTYNVATGAWTDTGDSYDTNLGNALVAGAVDLHSGIYYFGGFTSDGGQFKIWQYNAGANPRFTQKGYIATGSTSSNQNGDMAFDANGNLFVVRGSGTSTTVYSVSAASFAAASGNQQIQASPSTTVTTMSSVNGVAFDSSGRAFLGASSELRSYAMPSWTGAQSVTSNLSSSTDLASCSSPATITVQKVVAGRVNTTDQFTLTLKDGSQTLGTATTAGTAMGLQQQIVGPQPTERGKVLTFSESAAGGANLNAYSTTYQCTVDGQSIAGASGTGASGSVTIPVSGSEIVC